MQDAFTLFSASHPAALVFVTDKSTRQALQAGIASLCQRNIVQIVVLPFTGAQADTDRRAMYSDWMRLIRQLPEE